MYKNFKNATGICLAVFGFVLILLSATVMAQDPGFVFSDLTVKDKKAGLMWTKKANLSGKGMPWNEANDYIKQLNKDKYAGFSDWRLPTKDELAALANYGKGLGKGSDAIIAVELNRIGFVDVKAKYYWTSTTDTKEPDGAWNVSMLNGHADIDPKTVGNFAWPVRADK